jgi:hypothetical protein
MVNGATLPVMARPLRIEFEGAWYHVMNRGAGWCWVVLGGDDFISQKTQKSKSSIDVPELKAVKKIPSKAEIISCVLKVCDVTKKELMTSRRGRPKIKGVKSSII